MSAEDKPHTPPKPVRPSVSIGHMVRKYWPTAVTTFVAVVTGTVFYTLGQTRIYQAEATVMFDPRPPKPLGHRVETIVDLGTDNYWGNQEYYETQYHIIKSRRISLMVVNELGLHNDLAFLQNTPSGGSPKGTSAKVSPERAADELRGRIEVQPVRDSRLATVKLKDANPDRAQRILSALIDSYVNQNLENALENTSTASDWLRNQLDTLNGDLKTSEEALHSYKKQNDILSVAFDDKSSMLSDEMKAVNAELTRVKALLQEASARKAVLDSVPENDPRLIQSSELMKSAVLTSLRAQFEQASSERDALLGAGKGKNHHEVRASERRVRSAEAAIQKEIQNIKRSVARDLEVLGKQAGGLQGMLNKSKDQAHSLNQLEIEFNRLRRNKENTEKLYSLVLERTKEADLAQMMRVNNISVVDRPLQPRSPVSPKVPLNLAAGIFGGLLLGIAAAFIRGLMDRTVKVPDDLEEEFGLTFLGLLPQVASGLFGSGGYKYGYAKRKRRRGQPVKEGKPELIVHDQPTSNVAEASRAIRTNLMFMAPDNPHQVLLVTSPGPSEGKTTVACSISVAMAQTGQRVLLVDCDLRRPRIHRVFDRGSESGVSTALLGGSLDEAITPTPVPNLYVLPAGPIPPNPAELLHTEKFRQLIAELRGRYDRVIIDSPPVVAVTDPTILSTLVDGTVLVVRAFKTRKELARHALRSIQDVGGKLVGGVLNAVDFSKIEYKYSYYYYRREGYYGEEKADAKTRERALEVVAGRRGSSRDTNDDDDNAAASSPAE
ncbi:MAG: polysaccharide biosynthesis tyrosine autokinase [Deltaproteobacteria bacterium]|nr:polysaccharide biosynthesis tyrosine autokinase [Deltaproteobacteria bacterium]